MLAVLLVAGVVRAESLDEQAKLKQIQDELKVSQEKLTQTREQRQAVVSFPEVLQARMRMDSRLSLLRLMMFASVKSP